ncbi:MAG: DNA polymerase III subunit beta [Gammaproteobacteria bacterium]|nr:DNA polymerase III subunit beta [Gammaproteobacteria bacterium]
MEFNIEKSSILPALNFVSQAVVMKSAIPIFKTIFISAEKGNVTVRATNNVYDMRYTVPADVKDEGACCVDNMLVGLLDCFSDGAIRFKKGTRLSITQGSRKHQLVYVDPEMFPASLDVLDINYEAVNAKTLLRALSCCLGSCLVTGDRPILQTYYVNPHVGQIITGDGTRVSVYDNVKVPGNIANPPAKILSSVLFSAIRSLSEETMLEACFGNRSGFRTPNWEIFVNSLSGEFPQVAGKVVLDALNVEPLLKIVFDKSELWNVLRICALYANRAYAENKQAQSAMVYDKGKLRFAMDVVDLSKVDEPIENFEATGIDNFEILVNPSYLLTVLENVLSEKVEMRFFSNIKPFLVLDLDDPNYVYLQIPLVMPKEVEVAKQTMRDLASPE